MDIFFSVLNQEWKHYLDNSTEQMLADIRGILTDQTVKYRQGKSRNNIVALYFEYDYDFLNIVFWAKDKSGVPITECTILPAEKRKDVDGDIGWRHFLPESIWRKVAESEDLYEGDNYDDLRCEYEEIKHKIFEEWFLGCWNTAIKGIENVPDAYFSVHDTYYLTDLKTGMEINSDEISERYKTL